MQGQNNKHTHVAVAAHVLKRKMRYEQEHYIDNQAISAVARILESLGYTEDELKGKQMSLGDW
jgi:DNA polymerase elongation subunit (family B)